MVTEERMKTLFTEANPIKDSESVELAPAGGDDYLATLQRRSSEMTQLDTKEPRSGRQSRRMIPWVAVAAVAVIIVGATLLLLNQRGADVSPADPAPESQAPEVGVVLAAIEAYNAGDIDALIGSFDSESPATGWDWVRDGETRYADEIFMNANRVITIVEPCRLSETVSNAVVCELAEYNDWHGAAGLTFEATSLFTVNEQRLIVGWTDNWSCCTRQWDFHHAFWDWMEVAYPEVYVNIAPATSDGLPGLEADPAHMIVALRYVDEFIAQSEDYPIDVSG